MRRFFATCATAVAICVPGDAQPIASRPLGSISFANSGAAAAQPHFNRGVLWLHHFAYDDAIAAFREAQAIDPAFALAYWGEAMSFNQPLWFSEEPQQARAALAKLGASPGERLAKAKTPREQMYLGAVEALFGPGDKRSRDQAYLTAMSALAQKFPQDDEAQVFHALAILATLPRGDASLPLREKAFAVAERVFARNPQHPGAAHYIIHACDHATLAARALPAARAFATIAPTSHALHMPAHTFVQLGLWDEAAATDQASWDASTAWAMRHGFSAAARDYHTLTWLQYEWTQQGRFDDAVNAIRLIDEAMKLAKSSEPVGGYHYADSDVSRGSGPVALRNDRGSMRARYVIESERWHEMKGQSSFDHIEELFALGMSAAKSRDFARADAAIKLFNDAAAPGQTSGLREQAAVMGRELEALVAFARGRQNEAFAALDAAYAFQSRMPKPIGRPYPIKGVDELYGELLLQAGRATEAMVWFDRALTRTPNRSRAVLGLARAAAKAGDVAKSRSAYEQFLWNWRSADPDLPEIREAREATQ